MSLEEVKRARICADIHSLKQQPCGKQKMFHHAYPLHVSLLSALVLSQAVDVGADVIADLLMEYVD